MLLPLQCGTSSRGWLWSGCVKDMSNSLNTSSPEHGAVLHWLGHKEMDAIRLQP